MAETGKIFNTLEFGNVNSGDYGVYITGTGVYNAPARAVEMVSVPGRNGDVPIDMGHWDNIEVRYKCGLFGIDQSEMGEALMKFRNAIASQIGYQRLSDSYNPNEFRLGLFMAGLEFDAVSMNRAGEFELKFNCKPQRFLADGEEMIDVKSDWSDLKTASGEVVTFEVEDGAAANYTQFKSLVADINPIQDLHGYDHPWVGGAGKNKFPPIEGGTVNGITAVVNDDGSVTLNGTTTSSNARFRPTAQFQLKAGTYILSGNSGYPNTAIYLNGISGSTDVGSGARVTLSEDTLIDAVVQVYAGKTVSNVRLYPMIRLATESDTYEPYANICPISGRDSVDVSVCGINVWDEEWRNGYYNASTGEFAPYATQIANTNPISVKPSTSYAVVPRSTTIRFVYLDANKEVISVANATNSITTPSNCYYINFNMFTAYGNTYNNDISINHPATDTEYHAYNGHTHTATFDETVYGGEYDFVDGYGSVELAKATYDGSEAWAKDSDLAGGIHRFYVANNNIKKYGDYTNVLISNKCRATTNYQSAASMVDDFAVTAYNITLNQFNWIYIFSKTIDTVDGIKAWLTDTPLEVVYPLATPRTIQLDPQTITTLVGVNNVWADSGDVSVEYGVRPGALVNPTQYESSPVIEIEGTGDVSLNDYVIAIDDSVVGEVELADQRSIQPLISSRGALTETIDMAETLPLLAEGDSFRLSSMVLTTRWNASSIYTYTVSEQPTDGTATIEAASLANNLLVVARINPLTFAKGTAQSYTEVFEVTRTVSNPGGSSGSGSIAFTTVVSYDGASTLSITRTFSVAGTYFPIAEDAYGVIGAVIGSSSIPAFTGTVIIDSETGDAYRIEDGTYISLNKYIQLGAQLPTLRPGANIITYDDTIESLKIAPRWWRL